MRKNHGDEELKASDLFYALWVPDLFMQRMKAMKNGLLCVQMNVRDYLMYMAMNLLRCIPNMKMKEKEEKQ